MGTCDFFHQWTQTQASLAQGAGWGRGAREGGRNFSWRPGGGPTARRRQGWPSDPRQRLRSGPPPPLFSPGIPLRRHAPGRPRHPAAADPARAERQAWWGWGRRRRGRWGRGGCLLDARWAPVAHRRLRAGAEARSWRSRRLEGAVLTVARGRLNPLLPLQGLGEGAEEVWLGAPTGTTSARASRAPLARRPAPRPPPLLPPHPHPAPNSLPVGPRLVGRGRRQRQPGDRSLHDSGWDGGVSGLILFVRNRSRPGELRGRREVCHRLGAAGDAGSPPAAFSPPRPGSASFRVGGRRRGGRTEHAQLGGRTAEELAASALRSASPGFRSRIARSPRAAAPGPALGRLPARERAAPEPLSRSRPVLSASTSPKVAAPVAWAGNLTCAWRV